LKTSVTTYNISFEKYTGKVLNCCYRPTFCCFF